jgi:hypothetical protein
LVGLQLAPAAVLRARIQHEGCYPGSEHYSP